MQDQLHHEDVDDLRHQEGHKGHQGLEEIVDGHKQLKDLHHHEGHKGEKLLELYLVCKICCEDKKKLEELSEEGQEGHKGQEGLWAVYN